MASELNVVRIELLYFDGCPNFEKLASTVRSLLAGEGVDGDLAMRRIASTDDAKEARFLGSPTIRIDGKDVERAANARKDYGMKCRLYRTCEGLVPVPPTQWITAAIRSRRQRATEARSRAGRMEGDRPT